MTSSIFSTPLPDLSQPGAYAGIGSRKTPDDVLRLMFDVAGALARRGWTLRSGAAPGADEAFERGSIGSIMTGAAGDIELYLPWPRFENRIGRYVKLDSPTMKAESVSARLHPGWSRMTRGVRMLHARNAHQILGANCDDPVRFVLCWTPDGATTAQETSSKTGGTGQAIRVAFYVDAPVYNLQRHDHRRLWEEWLKSA